MLRQASIKQLRMGSFSREQAYVAICMCFHPRNLRSEMRDEYLPRLAPDRALFREWKEREKAVGHESAFAAVNYEERFQLSRDALEDLHRLALKSVEQDVFLVCQCASGQRCHRELLLLVARAAWDTKLGHVYHRYECFEARIPTIVKAWH